VLPVGLAVAGCAQGGPAHAGQPAAQATPPGNYLTAIRAHSYPGYDRLVFQFTGGTPGYTIRYGTSAGRTRRGHRIRLGGRSFVTLVFKWASAWRLNLTGAPPRLRTYSGPRTLKLRLPGVVQVRLVGDSRGYLRFGAGLRGRLPVRAYRLTGARRIVVFIAHPAGEGLMTAGRRPSLTAGRRLSPAARAAAGSAHPPVVLLRA
jgi:hypothetical protein